MKLHELTKMIRSKNAGPFTLTIDIMFETKEKYEKVKDSNVLTCELISELYNVPLSDVQYYDLPLALAMKFSIPRDCIEGSFQDTDIFGCQYHQPLVLLDIPD